MTLNETYSCEKCAFFFAGRVIDRTAKTGKGVARAYRFGHICSIRPPIAEKSAADTEPMRVCALFTDRKTGAQPLRYALPEIMHPYVCGNGKD